MLPSWVFDVKCRHTGQAFGYHRFKHIGDRHAGKILHPLIGIDTQWQNFRQEKMSESSLLKSIISGEFHRLWFGNVSQRCCRKVHDAHRSIIDAGFFKITLDKHFGRLYRDVTSDIWSPYFPTHFSQRADPGYHRFSDHVWTDLLPHGKISEEFRYNGNGDSHQK